MVLGGISRGDGWIGDCGDLRADEYRGREGAVLHVDVASDRALVAIYRDGFPGAIQIQGASERGHHANDVERGHDWRPAHLYVELHGVGQRVDDRDRSREAAEDLSASDARCGSD